MHYNVRRTRHAHFHSPYVVHISHMVFQVPSVAHNITKVQPRAFHRTRPPSTPCLFTALPVWLTTPFSRALTYLVSMHRVLACSLSRRLVVMLSPFRPRGCALGHAEVCWNFRSLKNPFSSDLLLNFPPFQSHACPWRTQHRCGENKIYLIERDGKRLERHGTNTCWACESCAPIQIAT